MEDGLTLDMVRDRAAAARRAAEQNRQMVRATVASAQATRAQLRAGGIDPTEQAGLVRELHAGDLTEAVARERVVALAGRAVAAADHASITTPGPATVAATGELPRQLDLLQYATGTGPCLDALGTARPTRSPDLAGEARWTTFTAGAVGAGVRSVLSVPMEGAGSLNLYATRPGVFGPRALAAASAYAVHAAVALARAAEQDQLAQLRQAVASNRVIGTAIGLLMGAHRISEAAAFDWLRVTSQHSNRKLRDIAAELVERGVTD